MGDEKITIVILCSRSIYCSSFCCLFNVKEGVYSIFWWSATGDA